MCFCGLYYNITTYYASSTTSTFVSFRNFIIENLKEKIQVISTLTLKSLLWMYHYISRYYLRDNMDNYDTFS